MRQLWLVLLLAPQLIAQCRTDFVSYVATSGAYTPATGATVLVCGLGATGTPCSPVLPIYTDQTLTTLASNPIVADAQGSFTVCAKVSTVYLQTTYRGSTKNQPTYFISAGPSATPLSGITPALTANTILNGNFQQSWQWLLTGTAPQNGIVFSESGPSTNTGANAALIGIGTSAGSTIDPLYVANRGASCFAILPTNSIAALGSCSFAGNLTGNVTGNIVGANATFTGPVSAGSFSGPLTGNVTGNITGTTGTFNALVTGGSFNSPGLIGPGCLGTDANGNFILTPGNCQTATGGTTLNSILGATATATRDSANFPINWNWTAGSGTGAMFKIGETTAATGNSTLFAVQSSTGSSITPFCALASMNNGFCLNQTGVMQSQGTFQISLVRSTSGAGNQLQLGPSATTGGWFNSDSNSPSGFSIAGGAMKSGGITWQARATTAAGIGINDSPLNNGLINFYSNSGLTVGNTFTPTSLGNLGPGGLTLSSLVSAATSCLQATAAGLIQITNFPCGGATGGTSLSGLTPATATNTIGNGTFQQNWQWNFGTNSTGSAMVFSDTTQSPDTSPFMSISTLSSGMTPLDLGTNLNASQLHFGKGGVSGGWLTGSGTGQGQLSGGSSYSGSSWIGQSSSAAIISVNDSLSGNINFYGDTGLTTGNPYTPTRMMQLSPPGNLLLNGLAGTGSRCLHTDASGNVTPMAADCSTGAGTVRISDLLPANKTNSISNGPFAQGWSWSFTGPSTGLGISESSSTPGAGASLLKVSTATQGIQPLDVIGTTDSEIHFGNATTVGGWLSHLGGSGAFLSFNSKLYNNAWQATNTASSILGVYPSSLQFYSNSGLTVGNTFTPTQIATLDPVGGLKMQNTSGTSMGNIMVPSANSFDFGTATWNGANWVANGPVSAIFQTTATATAFSFFADTGLTAGNTYAPTQRMAINPTGVAVQTGVNQGSGLKHQRVAGCATTAAVNGTCTGTITWTTPFADNAYTVVCNPVTGANLVGVMVTSSPAASVGYTLYNTAGNAVSSTTIIECIAMHD